MKKITEETKRHWEEGTNYTKDNTRIRMGKLYLFDNLIAQRGNGGKSDYAIFSMAGYNTVTTRERLKAVGVNIRSVRGVPMWTNCSNGDSLLCRPPFPIDPYGWYEVRTGKRITRLEDTWLN